MPRNPAMDIYLSTSSIRKTRQQNGLKLIDLPSFVRRLGFDGLEMSDREFGIDENHHLTALARACRRNACKLIIDINADLTYANPRKAAAETGHAKKMIEIAAQLKIDRLRICLGGQLISIHQLQKKAKRLPAFQTSSSPTAAGFSSRSKFVEWAKRMVLSGTHFIHKQMPSPGPQQSLKTARAVSQLRQVVTFATHYGVKLGIENHWGITTQPENILNIVTEIHSPFLGTCPDFDNFPQRIDRYAALALLTPQAGIVHAKSCSFAPNGEEKRIDYQRCLAILKAGGFDGPITVEYTGRRADELENCLKTRRLIRKYW
jgi:sugar phosphate isomerase/epimerase